MSDFGTIVDRIKEEVHRPNDDILVKRAVVDSISEWKVRRLGFNVREWSFQTVAEQDEYKFPSSDRDSAYIVPLEIDSCRILINNYWHTLTPINFGVFQSEFNRRNDSDNGYPSVYAIGPYDITSTAGRVIIVDPDPNDEYTIQGHGLCDISNITVDSSDASTNAWFTEGERLIRTQAKINLFVNNYQSEGDARLLIPQLINARDNLLQLTHKIEKAMPIGWY